MGFGPTPPALEVEGDYTTWTPRWAVPVPNNLNLAGGPLAGMFDDDTNHLILGYYDAAVDARLLVLDINGNQIFLSPAATNYPAFRTLDLWSAHSFRGKYLCFGRLLGGGGAGPTFEVWSNAALLFTSPTAAAVTGDPTQTEWISFLMSRDGRYILGLAYTGAAGPGYYVLFEGS